MITVFASNEPIDRDQLLSQLKGKYARKCLDKIEVMNGRIVAIDHSRGQWADGNGEHIWYEVGEPGDSGLCELRTDDSCVSFGPAPAQSRTELIRVAVDCHERRLKQIEQDKILARSRATNLVSSPA